MRAVLVLLFLTGFHLMASAQKNSDSKSLVKYSGSLLTTIKYSKITGTFLNFQNGQRIDTGISFSSQKLDSEQKVLIIKTYQNNKVIETHLILKGPKFLEFTSRSDDPRIPVITGEFFSSDFEDCILKSALPDKSIDIYGVVTKIDLNRAVSLKTLTDSATGKIIGIVQEQVELISEAEFKVALKIK
jgi:hypothetical protein